MRAPTENHNGSPVTRITARRPFSDRIVSIIASKGEGQAIRSAVTASDSM